MNTQKIFEMDFAKVYSLLVGKAERKGHQRWEVDQLAGWLTGYSPEEIRRKEEESISYGSFFENAPVLNPLRKNIRGTICGVRIENIEEPLMRDIRCLDKLVDELAKGKTVEKILAKLESAGGK